MAAITPEVGSPVCSSRFAASVFRLSLDAFSDGAPFISKPDDIRTAPHKASVPAAPLFDAFPLFQYGFSDVTV